MPFVTAKDGTDLYVKDWGSGPPVVFIHGWPLNADMWEYQQPAITAAGFRTVSYDRRGFGRSDQPWSGYDYDTFADDLAAILDGLDLTGATLVGFSMGGGEVARYLSKYGTTRVAKAVLVSAVTPFLLQTGDNPDGAPQSLFDDMVAGLNKDRAHFLAGFGKNKFMASGMMHAGASPEGLLWTQQMALMASPAATIACVRAFSGTDFRSDLAAFTVPTLVIHGTHDETVPIDISGRKTAAAIPHAQFIAYEGAPHGLMFTDADKLNADLLTFLRA